MTHPVPKALAKMFLVSMVATIFRARKIVWGGGNVNKHVYCISETSARFFVGQKLIQALFQESENVGASVAVFVEQEVWVLSFSKSVVE